jgi:hypothetical protein
MACSSFVDLSIVLSSLRRSWDSMSLMYFDFIPPDIAMHSLSTFHECGFGFCDLKSVSSRKLQGLSVSVQALVVLWEQNLVYLASINAMPWTNMYRIICVSL